MVKSSCYYAVSDAETLPQFIETEVNTKDGSGSEKKIWDACKKAFRGRECLGFWRYPVFSKVGEKRKEPDILLVDRELGVIVVEVKAISIDQLSSIDGSSWIYEDFYEDSGSPYSQAEDSLFVILGRADRESKLRRKIRGRALVALANIQEIEWNNKGFNQQMSAPPVLFCDGLGEVGLLKKIENTPPVQTGAHLDGYQWALLLSIIGGSRGIAKAEKIHQVVDVKDNSRLEIMDKLRNGIYSLDLQQLRIAMEIPPGVQRIRGIAGSGKTMLLCQRAAHMHLKHPDWDIALIFFTRSLYEQMENSVDHWLRYFSDGDVSYNDMRVRSRIKIFHAWGSKDREGFYRHICKEHNVMPLNVSHTPYKSPHEGLADVCARLLNKCYSVKPLFDAILIDEGQDLVVDENSLKYEGKQPFYWLAYQSLKPCESGNPIQRRLTWAYDEAQSLDTLSIPDGNDFFGDKSILKGFHKGGMHKSMIMKRCYRTPLFILTAAQGLGMGVLRSNGMVSGITSKAEWENIGYEVSQGNFRENNSKITLRRPLKNSPNSIHKMWKDKYIEFHSYSSRQEELQALSKRIRHNIHKEGIAPARNILVIVLGDTHESMNIEDNTTNSLINSGVDIFVPSATRLNQIKPKYPDNDPDAFWHDGGVTVSRIFRAKGNEADIVYVIGLDTVAHKENKIHMRNQLLVAITRARGWVVISGVEDEGCYPFYDEVKAVLDSGDTFNFTNKKKQVSEDEEEAAEVF